MPKQRLVEINLFDKLFKNFLKSKVDNKENDFIAKLRKKDPELANIYSDWNDKMNASIMKSKAVLQKLGKNTSHLDDFINKYH